MRTTEIIQYFESRGFRFALAGEDGVVVAPQSRISDAARQCLKCFRSEIRWRLRHPEGDPDVDGYLVAVFVNGERIRVPLDQLTAQGRAIIECENLPPPKTNGFDPDLWAASV